MHRVIAATAIALALAPGALAAKDHGHGSRDRHQAYGQSCPPGLAKKSPACVPPGQAKKHYRERDEARDEYRDRDHDHYDRDHYHRDGDHYHYRVGDRITDYGDLVLIRDPGRYALDPYGTYYRAGDYVIRVDRETSQVLALVGLVSAILGG